MESNNRPCLESKMPLNNVGKFIDCWWNELSNHFSSVKLDDYVIMPNHIHGIIVIRNDKLNDNCGRTRDGSTIQMLNDSGGRTRRSAPTIVLGNIIQWFKTMSTNEYIRNVKTKNWPKFDKRLFQRNYFEEIIKNEKQYFRIKEYIENNPINMK